MIAPVHPEVYEAMAALENNQHFKAVKGWLKDCAVTSLTQTAFVSDKSSEETFRALGAFHTLRLINETIEQAPERSKGQEYRGSRDTS